MSEINMSEKPITVFICPRCETRSNRSPSNNDIICPCVSNNPTLDEEDVLVLGAWEDFTGSSTDGTNNKIASSLAGVQNTLQGTRAWVEREKNFDRTDRGRNANIYRQRQHLQFIDFRKSGR